MTQQKAINELKALQREELAATETYQQALDILGEEEINLLLREIHNQHREAANELRKQIREFGGEPEQGSGTWGAWAKAVQGTAKLFGKSMALQALRIGEEIGVRSYNRSLKQATLPRSALDYIRSTLLPQTKQHVRTLNRIIHQ